MGLARYFAKDIPVHGTLWLDESESHHAIRVLRSQVGDDVLVFDGLGFEGFGTIAEVGKKQLAIQISGRRFAPRDHDGKLVFAIAMPKGDRQRNVVERLVELGVDSLIPIDSERSVAKLDQDAIARLERYGLEACKQCLRNRLLHIAPSVPFSTWIKSSHAATNDAPSNMERWLVHPGNEGLSMSQFVSQSTVDHRAASDQAANQPTFLFAIGPEGGFSKQEVDAALTAGFQMLQLGERILRVETAVAAVATLGILRVAANCDGSQVPEPPTTIPRP